MSFNHRLFRLLAVVAFSLSTAFGAAPDAPTADFANRIVALTGQAPIALTFRNASSLDAEQVRVIRTGIETQLRASGVKFLDNAAVQVRVTLSQNVRGWLWLGEVMQGTSQKVIMYEVPVADTGLVHRGTMSLKSDLLFASDAPILDVLRVNAPNLKLLMALSPTQVTVFQPNGAGWVQQQTIKLERNTGMPRDARGHLVAASDHLFDIYLPGSVCSSNAAPPISVTCREADDLWPLGGQNAFFNASRNYFTGLLRPGFGKVVSPFYSAASLAIADRSMWIFAGVDGQARWTDGGAEQLLPGTSDWGSDIAALRSGCGAGTQVVATAKGDLSDGDSLRAFETLNQQANPVSQPLSLRGAITSMWTQVNDGAVTATIRTARGSYEAYAISLSCN